MSRPISVIIPHDLGRAEARRRVDEGFAGFSRHMGAAAGALQRTWAGDKLDFAFRALGQGISGVIEVEDKAVRLEVLLPELLAMMAETLKGRLRREGQLLLEKK
jgi:putative polyhydroxyalkanoate system protein